MSWRDEMYTANEKALQAEVRRLRNVVRDLEDQIDQLRKENPDWIPVSTGNFPKDEEKVLVTYLGYGQEPMTKVTGLCLTSSGFTNE